MPVYAQRRLTVDIVDSPVFARVFGVDAYLGGSRHVAMSPAPSAEPGNAAALASEAEFVHSGLLPFAPWVRELFPTDRQHWKPDDCTWAHTVNTDGLVVREFRVSQRSLDAYRDLAARGSGTCPLEAVLPCSIAIRQPAIAAHEAIQCIQGWLASR